MSKDARSEFASFVPTHHSKVKRFQFQKSATLAVLVLVSVAMIFPLLWMLSTALKPLYDIFQLPPQLVPHPALWSNFGYLFSHYAILHFTWNTVYLTVMNIVGTGFSSVFVAYGFSRFNAPGKSLLFGILLATMMIPWAVTLVPLFILYKTIGWYNTYLPLWVPSFLGNPFYIFLLRQFMLNIPNELYEAAEIEGANALQCLWHVAVPVIRSAVTVVIIFQFFATWNDFLAPLIFLSDPGKATLQLAIQNLQTQFNTPWNYMMGFSLLSIVPCLIVFFIAQRRIIEGIAVNGLKS